MNKWTWVVLVVLVAVLGVSYSMLSHRNPSLNELNGSDADLNVEEYETPESESSYGEVDASAGDSAEEQGVDAATEVMTLPGSDDSQRRRSPLDTTASPNVETIDEADENGEVVSGPTVIEDDSETGNIEIAKPE